MPRHGGRRRCGELSFDQPGVEGWSPGRGTLQLWRGAVGEDIVAGESDAAAEGDGFRVLESGEIGELDTEGGGGGGEDAAGDVVLPRRPAAATVPAVMSVGSMVAKLVGVPAAMRDRGRGQRWRCRS